MAKKWVVGNWKMNLGGEDGLSFLSQILNNKDLKGQETEIAICPPFTILKEAALRVRHSSIKIGAQNCSWADSGAFTGEVSPRMLKDLGCQYVILGHSERRSHFHETSQMVCQKAEKALESGLVPIICIGETESERLEGKTLSVLKKQLQDSLPINPRETIIAYEPVWAIGTGRVPSLEEIQEVFQELALLSLPILYGGSVNASNIHSFGSIEGMRGVLVGGSSLKQQEFEVLVEEVGKWS